MANAIAVDKDGHVYVAGYSYGPTGNWDYLTLKYDADGKRLWFKRFSGLADKNDGATVSVSIADSGDVYVTGYSTSGANNLDYLTLKYNAAGKRLWFKRYNGSGKGSDIPSAIAVDGEGNVHIAGYSYGDSSGDDYATLKYDGDGTLLWEKRYHKHWRRWLAEFCRPSPCRTRESLVMRKTIICLMGISVHT